jgi:hypothetical protein
MRNELPGQLADDGAGLVNGPVIVGVFTSVADNPFGWRNVDTTLSPCEPSGNVATPTAS